jgi:hypothetical protein
MSRAAPVSRLAALCVSLVLAGCTTTPATPGAGANVSVEGTIASIDTQPWTYDGPALIGIDTADGRVQVALPARWNLCQAAPVDVEALSVGMRVHATGARDPKADLVVCEDAAHRLVPMQ